MTNHRSDSKLEAFRIVTEHYRNDFQLFWQRTNFFLIVDAGLLGFFFTKPFNSSCQCASQSAYLPAVCLAGAALSLIWFLVAISSLRWINVWRQEVVRIDEKVNPFRSFSNGEQVKRSVWRFHLYLRPEVVSAGTPVLFITVWLFVYFFRLK